MSIGSFIKKNREQKQVSLEALSLKTKISLKLLKNLEADDLKSLPNPTFVKGYIKSLARELKFDINEGLTLLSETYKNKLICTEEVDTPISEDHDEDELKELKNSGIDFIHKYANAKTALIALSVVFVIFIIISINKIINNVTTQKDEIKNKQQKAITHIKDKDESLFNLKISEKLKQDTKQSSLNQKEDIAPPKKSIQKEEITSQKKGMFPFKKFYPAPQKTYEIVKESPLNQESQYQIALEEGMQNIAIYANDDTWISYKVDNQKIKRYILKAGKNAFLKGKTVLLFMGNVHATNIFLNNQHISVKSKTGVKSLIFPNNKSQNYELPLFPTFNGTSYTAKEYKAKMIKN
ncbi:MAG: helix-turn-helix domain-containing protein [Bacteriovoracaceae bacterium]|jgi:cytoskeletal protein RodZ|nr:helix-turn-helix domain-containing protein [Bacteriovoracaceae bacterium]